MISNGGPSRRAQAAWFILLVATCAFACAEAKRARCLDGTEDDGTGTCRAPRSDACSVTCPLQDGFDCVGGEGAERCLPVCGDGWIRGDETCDVGTASSEGCSSACLARSGFECRGEPSVCTAFCGDGLRLGAESCDDGDFAGGDGCSPTCSIEPGYACDDAACAPVCGDHLVVGLEGCDDGNQEAGDGCSPECGVSEFWRPLPIGGAPDSIDAIGVWTGSSFLLYSAFAAGGFELNLANEIWTAIPVIELAGFDSNQASGHWTGSGWLVFDEYNEVGALYAPSTRSWRPVPRESGPGPRTGATQLWTGRELLVWGGTGRRAESREGASYDPATNVWVDVERDGAVLGRFDHSAVWTGTEMLVWGGFYDPSVGDAYSPATRQWRRFGTVDPPTPRSGHSAVWTGAEMIVWGGQSSADIPVDLDDGAAYDPVTDRWRRLPDAGAPSARDGHEAFWTGSEMLVWSSQGGARYVPALDRWLPISTDGAPRGTGVQVLVGARLFVWGGSDAISGPGSGAIYDPATDRWTSLTSDALVLPRSRHSTVWTGSEMIVFGGAGSSDAGQRLDLAAGRWRAVQTIGAPPARFSPTAVWTGREMIVFGGRRMEVIHTPPRAQNDGGAYDPAADTWRPLGTTGLPGRRSGHSAVWTGQEMIVWGGIEEAPRGDGARYDPVERGWRPMSMVDAPSARSQHAAVWTGRQMIVWGGTGRAFTGYFPHFDDALGDGGIYDPDTDTWTPIPASPVLGPRIAPVAAWSGQEMMVFGGQRPDPDAQDGGRFDPDARAWRAMSPRGAPSRREGHVGGWSGRFFVVWGGQGTDFTYLGDGARYDPVTDTWSALPSFGAPAARAEASAVDTPQGMLVWGGVSTRTFADGSILSF